jgi:hypothetical protein
VPGTGSVLSVVSRGDRPQVRATARRLHHVLGVPLDVSPAFRRRLTHQIAAIAPDLPVDRLELLARHAICMIRFDDVLDRQTAGPEALQPLVDAVTAVTLGIDDGSSNPLLATLAGIVGELAGYDRSGRTLGRYVNALQDWITAEVAMVQVRQAVAAGGRQPTAEEYLALAARTVNYRSFAYALLVVTGGSLSAGQLACVDSPLWHAAWAVRLGNDLRGLPRDQGEPVLNVLWLRTEAGSPVTPAYLREEIRRRAKAHDDELRALSGLGAIAATTERTLTRCLHQSVQLYLRTDVRAE